MREAIQLARRGLGRTAPNPAVGCVLVRDGEVVGRGWHHAAGRPHAEVEAIRDAGKRTEGAIAYVTLEPCNHTGRTGPCTEALIAAGVTRVVLGARDPNPKVEGDGVGRLKAAGLEVELGVLEAECAAVLAPFATWTTTGRPLVTLKVATTLDGRIATSTGHSQWVTGEAARRDVHRRRNENDAVMVGGGTVRADDPALTTRGIEGGRHALRVVLSASMDLPTRSQLFTDGLADTLVLTTSDRVAPVETVRVTDLAGALDALGARGVTSVLVEAGRGLATALLAEGLADRLACYVAPKVIGGDGLGWAGPLLIRTMERSIRLADVEIRPLGDDVCIEGRCVYGDR